MEETKLLGFGKAGLKNNKKKISKILSSRVSFFNISNNIINIYYK